MFSLLRSTLGGIAMKHALFAVICFELLARAAFAEACNTSCGDQCRKPGIIPTQPVASNPSTGANNSSTSPTGPLYTYPKAAWVALQDVGDPAPFFDRLSGQTSVDSIKSGEVLRANRDVNMRLNAAYWKHQPRILNNGSLVVVIRVETLKDKNGNEQRWAHVYQTDPERFQ